MPSQLVRDATVDRADMLLVGQIGVDIHASDIESSLRLIGKRPLEIFVCSTGGSAAEGERIYAALRRHAERNHVSARGLVVHSAAVSIFLAAHQRAIARNGSLHIHDCTTVALPSGLTPDFLRDLAKSLERQSRTMLRIYEEATGIDRTTLAKIMKANSAMTSADAVALGFAHEICHPIYGGIRA